MLTPKIPLAKEGYPFIAVAAFATLLSACLGSVFLTVVLFAITIFILCFFRDPERFLPEDSHALVAPADGKIILIDEVDDTRFTQAKALHVAIFMNVFNVHVNRSPCSATVLSVYHKPGRFHAADSDKSCLENEYCAVMMTTPDGHKLAVVQIAGLIARRIVCWLENGDTLARGQRIGLIRFGSRVDLYLPTTTTLSVKVGDKVRAGETSLGRIM